MSKRFIDTGIWEKPWFMELTPAEKMAVMFIMTKCDNVGVWVPNFKLAAFQIGDDVDWDALVAKCHGNIEVLPDGKWFMVDFCRFQYGELSEDCKPHQSYLALLSKHGLSDRVGKGLDKPMPRLKDKDKEKEEDKDSLKERQPTEAEKVAKVVSYLNEKTGRSYNAGTKATTRLVLARIRDGHHFIDFQRVIDNRVQVWGGDPKMAEYLRPETLFGTKFDSYLATAGAPKTVAAAGTQAWTCAHCGHDNHHTGGMCLKCKGERDA